MNIGNADNKIIEKCTVTNRIKQIMASAFNISLNGNAKIASVLFTYSIIKIY